MPAETDRSSPPGAFDAYVRKIRAIESAQVASGKTPRTPSGQFPAAGHAWEQVRQHAEVIEHVPEHCLPRGTIEHVNETLIDILRQGVEFSEWDQASGVESFDAPGRIEKLKATLETLKNRTLPVIGTKHAKPSPPEPDFDAMQRAWKTEVVRVIDERLSDLRQLRTDIDRSAQENERKYTAIMLDGRTKTAAMVAEIEETHKESKSLIAGIREAAGTAAMSEHALIYAQAESEHRKSALAWLGGLWLCVIGAIAYLLVFLFLWLPGESKSSPEAPRVDDAVATAVSDPISTVEQAIAHLSILSVAYFAIVFAGRNYRAHLHNAAVNRQKADAIRTFRAMSDWTKTDATLNGLVIARIADTVFTARATGFTSEDVEVRPPPPISDLLDAAAKSAGGARRSNK